MRFSRKALFIYLFFLLQGMTSMEFGEWGPRGRMVHESPLHTARDGPERNKS